MPGTPKPVVDPRFGPAWTPIIQGQQANKQQAAALNSGAQNTNIVDGLGNAIIIVGQVNQVVTVGAVYGQPGVQVGTGFPIPGDDPRVSPTAGFVANFSNSFCWGTVTTTAGSNSCSFTIDPASPGTPGTGRQAQIGAANVSDPSLGTPTPAITPGTYVNAVSGGPSVYTVTLSQNAAETGSGLYCVICFWVLTI